MRRHRLMPRPPPDTWRKPPEDIPPERLFRLLSRVPRATAPLTQRIKGAEHIVLSVCCLTQREEIEALDDVGDDILSAYVLAALLADGQRAFGSIAEVYALADGELEHLGLEVVRALSRISPSRYRSDMTAWYARVTEGAHHVTNLDEVVAMATSMDVGYSVELGRPDRYYGLPVRELTEGQLMAYRAARAVMQQARGERAEQPVRRR